MFGSLKKKLEKALHVFSKNVAEESEEIESENEVEEIIETSKSKTKKEVVKEKNIKENLIEKTKTKEQSKEQTKEKEKQLHKPKLKPKEKQTPVEAEEKEIEKIYLEEKEQEEQDIQKPKEEVIEEHKPNKRFLGIFKRKEKHIESEESKLKEEQEKPPKEELKEKKSFFKRPLIRINISEKKFEELFWDIELALLENNVAVEVIEKLKTDLKENLLNHKLNAFALQKKVQEIFQNSLSELFDVIPIDLLENIKQKNQQKKPYIMAFIGVNGSGKTTSLAKVAYMLKKQNISIVIAACDNFRAAALHQIEEHANNLGIKSIKHDYGSDSAAVAFDAIKHAESKSINVVLIDTAGRSHSNINLMDELKKVIRVSNPDLKIFVGDSLTGNDTVDQAKSFDEAVGIDVIILSKMDIDEKGGASISVSYVTKKPIIFTGTGQNYEDLKPFDKEAILKSLEL